MNTLNTEINTPYTAPKGNEIITLSVGQCGIYMGSQFFHTIMNEHKINEEGLFTGNLKQTTDRLILHRSNTYFDETKNGKYIPRSILVDLEPTAVDKVRHSPLGTLIEDTNFISSGYAEPALIYARGHYTDGAELIDVIVDTVRLVMENCECPQGVQLMHAISGGTGGGLGTLILLKLRDNYPDRSLFTFTIYPSPRIHTNHSSNFEIYNTTLALSQLLENSDLNFQIDNGKLFSICANDLKLSTPNYQDINLLTAMVFSGITSSFRFDTNPDFNSNQRKMQTYFVPFPRLHFLATWHSPFFNMTNKGEKNKKSVQSIQSSITSQNDVSDIKLVDGKMLNWAVLYRCSNNKTRVDMESFLESIQQRQADDFPTWIPFNVQSAMINDGDNHCYTKYTPIVSTAISNTTAIKGLFQRVSSQFIKLYRRRTYLHWYRAEGMDETEFQDSNKNVRDLIVEYQDKQDAVVDLDHDDDDDEEEDDEEEEDEDEEDSY